MAKRATDRDPFRIWMDASREILEAASASEPVREQCEALFAAWRRFARVYAEAGAAGREAERGAAGGPFDPAAWMDAASGGGFGDLWQRFGAEGGDSSAGALGDILTASRQWRDYVAALGRYQSVMTGAWLAAFRRFAETVERESRPGALPTWGALRALWQEAADLELARAMRSEDFLSAQRELIRTWLQCSALLRERIDDFAAAFGLPTRSEVDQMAEQIHRLGREVRRLRMREGGE